MVVEFDGTADQIEDVIDDLELSASEQETVVLKAGRIPVTGTLIAIEYGG